MELITSGVELLYLPKVVLSLNYFVQKGYFIDNAVFNS